MLNALRGPDRVRKRPEVIFRSRSAEGACAAINEILKNSVEEARQGFGKKIMIRRYKDSSYEIEDYGRGVPVEYNNDEKEYDWQINFCKMYAMPRDFFKENDCVYSLGLYGLGLYATQCVSEYMDAEIIRDGYKYNLHFEKGYNIGGLKKERTENHQTGTKIRFKLDDEVFTDINVSCEMLKTLVRNYALTNKGVTFKFIYEDDCTEEMVFLYNNLSDRIAEHFKSKEVKTYNEYFKFEGEESGRTNSGSIDISIAFAEGEKLRESFCNGRFLQHEGIAVWSLEELIKDEISKRFSNITIENKVIEKVLNNISIIVNVEMLRYKEKWQSGFRAAITNPLVGESIKNRCQSMIEEMICDNTEKIKEAGK